MTNDSNPEGRQWRHRAWHACILSVLLTLLMVYSPLLMTPGITQPRLLGLPLVLWGGFAAALTLVALTAIGAAIHPVRDENA